MNRDSRVWSFMWAMTSMFSLALGIGYAVVCRPTIDFGANDAEARIAEIAFKLGEESELAVCDVKSSAFTLKRYYLMAWSRPQYGPVEGWTSGIDFISVDSDGKSKLIWQSPEQELYSPRIEVVDDFNHEGNQIYLVRRQAGAAAELIEPIWIEGETVHKAPLLFCDYFEIKQVGSGQARHHQLIGYTRPNGVEEPIIFEWIGDEFRDISLDAISLDCGGRHR